MSVSGCSQGNRTGCRLTDIAFAGTGLSDEKTGCCAKTLVRYLRNRMFMKRAMCALRFDMALQSRDWPVSDFWIESGFYCRP